MLLAFSVFRPCISVHHIVDAYRRTISSHHIGGAYRRIHHHQNQNERTNERTNGNELTLPEQARKCPQDWGSPPTRPNTHPFTRSIPWRHPAPPLTMGEASPGILTQCRTIPPSTRFTRFHSHPIASSQQARQAPILCRIDRKLAQTKIVDSRWHSERLVADTRGFDSRMVSEPTGTGTILMVLLIRAGADHSPEGGHSPDGPDHPGRCWLLSWWCWSFPWWMVPTKQNTIRPADGSGSGSIN